MLGAQKGTRVQQLEGGGGCRCGGRRQLPSLRKGSPSATVDLPRGTDHLAVCRHAPRRPSVPKPPARQVRAVGAVRPAVKPRRPGAVSQSPASTGQRPLLTRGPPGPTSLSSCLRPHVTRFPVHRAGPRATAFVVPADPRHAARPRRRLRAAVLPDVRGCLTRSPGEGGRVQQTGRPAAALSVLDSAFSIDASGAAAFRH